MDRAVFITLYLSDSKEFAIKRKTRLDLVEHLCEPGWRTAPAGDFLDNFLKVNGNKKYLIYIWLGTRYISVKGGTFKRVRCWVNSVIDHILSQYQRVTEIVKKYPNANVKFIEVPCFSVFAFNKFNGHTDQDSIKDQDKEICRQVKQLKSSIREIHSNITERTLPFNCDIKTS